MPLFWRHWSPITNGTSTALNLRTKVALLAFALTIRLIPLLLIPAEQYSFGDAHDYRISADSLCQGLSYPNATELPFFRAPGLPLFLALATACHPNSIIWGRLAIISTDLLSILGLISLGAMIGLRAKAQFLAALTFSISPLLVGQTLDIQSEPLFQCLSIWLTFFVLRETDLSRFTAGILYGLAALTRPVALGFFPLLLWGTGQISAHQFLKNILIFCVGAAVAITPWSITNYTRTGDFILINDAGGYNFWRGNHPIMSAIYATDDKDELARLSHKLEHQLTPELVAQSHHISPTARSTYFFQQGLLFFKDSPVAALTLLLKKCWIFLRPTMHGGAWPASVWWLIAIWETGLSVFASLTLFSRRLSSRARFAIGGYLILSLVLSIPFQVVTRFRVPLYEWILILLTARYFQRCQKATGEQ